MLRRRALVRGRLEGGGHLTVSRDGNAIAGLLQDVFGRDMTTVPGICEHCGDERLLAESRVYVRAPGVVVRCQTCHGVLMVLVSRKNATCIHLQVALGAAHEPKK